MCIIPHFSFVTPYPYPILTKLHSSQNIISLLVYKSCHKHIIYVILHFLNDQEQITSIEIIKSLIFHLKQLIDDVFSWIHGKMFPKYKKRNVTFFLVSFRYFIHVTIGARPLTTFYWRMSDIILRCEWTVVITCRVLNHCPPFDLMVKTSWIIIDRSTLIQYHVYFFLSNGLGGGGRCLGGPCTPRWSQQELDLSSFIIYLTESCWFIDRVLLQVHALKIDYT